MKVFKKIYFPVMAIMIALTMVFGFLSAFSANGANSLDSSFIDATMSHAREISTTTGMVLNEHGVLVPGVVDETSRNSINNQGVRDVREYILDSLNGFGDSLEILVGNDYHYAVASARVSGTNALPTVAFVNLTTNSDTLNSMTDRDDRVIFIREGSGAGAINSATQNVVVYIPGSDTLAGQSADTAVISVRIDAIGPEATNAATIGAMIEHVNRLSANITPSHSNDLVFVFADGGLEYDIGLRTVLNQFRLNRPNGTNVLGDVSFIAQFDSMGNRGRVMAQNSGTVQSCAICAVGRAGAVSSVVNLFDLSSNPNANPISNTVPSIVFSNIAGIRFEGTALDNTDNLSTNMVRDFANTMDAVINALGNADFEGLAVSENPSSVFFYYFNWFSVSYPAWGGFLMVGVIILLLGCIIGLNAKRAMADKKLAEGGKRKSYAFGKIAMGILIQAIALIVGAAVVFLLYSLMALLLAGFGVMSIQAFISYSLINPGIIISAIFIFLTAMIAVFIPLKKALGIKGVDVVRGAVFLTAILAIIFAFAIPSIAYLFTILSVLQLATMLVSMLVKDKFRAKFGFDIERLFLYVWPSIVMMPLFISAIATIAILSPLVMLPVYIALFAPLAMVLIPYADYLKPGVAKAFAKLPKQSVKVEEEVTEMIEDKAKKGRFVEKTYKKTTREKKPWNYRHGVGIFVVGLFAFISMILFSSFGGGFYVNTNSNSPTIENYFWHNAFNYTDDRNITRYEVRDLNAVGDISNYVGGLSWDANRDGYTMAVPNAPVGILPPEFDDTAPASTLIYRGFSNRSRVRVEVSGIASVTEIRIAGANGDAMLRTIMTEGNYFMFRNRGSDNITFFLPYSFGSDIQMEFTGGNGISVTITEESTETHIGSPIRQMFEMERVHSNLSSVRSHAIFTRTTTV